MFVCMIHDPVIKINDPIPMVVIFALLFLSSFIYQWAGVYTVAARSNMPTATASILRANFIFYGSLSVMFSITARGDGREFLLTWTLIALFVSTAILMFKRQITVGFVRLLRKKQFHLRKVIIVGDDTEGAADFIKRVTDDSKYGFMILASVGRTCELVSAVPTAIFSPLSASSPGGKTRNCLSPRCRSFQSAYPR